MINGLLVTRVKLNAWLVTLSMKLALVGIVVKLTNTVAINMPQEVLNFRNIKIFGLSSFIVFILAVMILMQILLRIHTVRLEETWSLWVPTIQPAEKLGINVKNYKLAAFIISGFFAGLGGMLISVNLGSITRELGDGYESRQYPLWFWEAISWPGVRGRISQGIRRGSYPDGNREWTDNVGADIYLFQIAKAPDHFCHDVY